MLVHLFGNWLVQRSAQYGTRGSRSLRWLPAWLPSGVHRLCWFWGCGCWPDFPAVAFALADLGAGVAGLDGGQLGDDFFDGYAGGEHGDWLGQREWWLFRGLRRGCRRSSWIAWTPLAQRGQAGQGPPVTQKPPSTQERSMP